MSGLTVIVTGSRDFADREVVRLVLDRLASGGPVHVRVGDCPTGADLYAREWCEPHAETFKVYRADWRAYGRAAGPKRNERMVSDGADLCVAFFAPPPADNVGTSGCTALAAERAIPVRRYGPEVDGRVWSDVEPGDVIYGADGRPWTASWTPRGAVELSHGDEKVYGRPAPGAAVVIIERGPTGRAVDLLRERLGAEMIHREYR